MKTLITALFLALAIQAQAQLNLSTRGYVSRNERQLIAGFVVSGTDYNLLVIRALGPSLPSYVPTKLSNPCVQLYDSQGNLMAFQDSYLENTQSDLAWLSTKHLTPTDANECAMLVQVQSGQSWTCIISGKWGTEGIALVEGYYFKI